MTADRLELSTKTSLFPAIEIKLEVEGKATIYRTRKLTRAFMREIEPVEEAIANQEGYEVIVKWIVMMYGIPEEVLDQLEEAEVEEIYLDTSEKFRDRQKERMDRRVDKLNEQLGGFQKVQEKIPKKSPAKNVKRPGDKK